MFQQTCGRRGVVQTFRKWMAWNKTHAAAKVAAAAGTSSPDAAGPSTSLPPEQVVLDRIERHRHGGTTPLDYAEATVLARRTWRMYDATRPLPQETLKRVLEATRHAPTGFNLQGWKAVIVQEPTQKAALAKAALGQRHVLEAPATIVFAGDTEPEANAPAALEMSLDAKAIPASYAPGYLRNIYYFLHGGPLQMFAAAKSVLSSAYSARTDTALLSVPVNMTGYAWKQTMIPVTTFVQLATAAGWETCVLEGIDQDAVRRVVGLPERFTVPVIVTVGYPLLDKGDKSAALNTPATPRFNASHYFHWEKY